MTELALPAGSLQAALVAFKEGADAVYLGMQRFSARKEAANFTFEDLAKLRQAATEQQKKIYVTVNTIITDSQMEDAAKLLRRIEFIGCDGVIVQDLGIARLIRDRFPSLPLHGSTQLAVHTVEGVRQLQDMGFARAVLARELTLEEIRGIREACPDIELKVFIHGALCYGVSGLCMASKQLCGRSANCGACAQICRSWFSLHQDSEVEAARSPLPKGNRTGWYFSMSDLKGGEAARQLADMGIDSLKVEGRMKGPAYVKAASRYYRAILDPEVSDEEKEALEHSLSVVFARRQTSGWLAGYGRTTQSFEPRTTPTLGSTSYPGHRGVVAAKVMVVKDGYAVITTRCRIAIRDGLMYFVRGKGQPVDTVKFSLSGIYDKRDNSITYAFPGETVEIELPRNEPLPHAGEQLYLISAHDQNPALLSESLPPAKKMLDLHLRIERDALAIGTVLMGDAVEQTYPLEVTEAKKTQDLDQHLKAIFSQSDRSYCTLGNLSYENRTGMPDESVFLPLSVLKAIRREWYSRLDKQLAGWFEQSFPLPAAESKRETVRLPSRELLCTPEGLPYLDVPSVASALNAGAEPESSLFKVEDTLYLPLSPVMFDERRYLEALDAIVARLEESNRLQDTLFGLNNLAQIRWANRHPKVRCFFDTYLYLANGEAAQLALELCPNLQGGYLWMETENYDESRWPFEPSLPGSTYAPPLFISRSCFRHDSLLLPCTGCPHNGSWYVTQQDHRYHVMVHDCITTVVKA